MRSSVFFLTVVMLLPCLTLAAEMRETKDTDQQSSSRGVTLVGTGSSLSRQVALVIGNSSYTSFPLKNPVNDAKDMAAKLRTYGFDVIERTDLSTRQIGSTLREFRSRLKPGDVALFFYAGHSVQIKGENYLPAVDADINSEEDIPNQSLSLKQIIDVLEESRSRLNLVFLDACRNNPYARSFRSADRGLARVAAPSGTLISYATRPGSVAADGNGRNGLYTSKLLEQMDHSNQIELLLKLLVREVKHASSGRQEPWMEGSIEGEFCFGGCQAESADNQGPRPVRNPIVTELEKRDLVMEVVAVDGGCFQMGDSFDDGLADEKPNHEVCLDTFFMGKSAVTVGQFRRFVDETGYRTEAEKGGGCYGYKGDKWAKQSDFTWRLPGFNQDDRHPVVCVSWNDANSFAQWLGNLKKGTRYRLPREAEWEYAARSGGRRERYAGVDDTKLLPKFGNICDSNCDFNWKIQELNDGYFYTAPVGSFQPNGLGLYDMTGNVWQWTVDWYAEDYYTSSPMNNPLGPSRGSARVFRGGGWGSEPAHVRTTGRDRNDPTYRSNDLGFRLIATNR